MMEPYIQLQGRSLEAILFYERVFKGKYKHIDYAKDYEGIVQEYTQVLYGRIELRGVTFHFSDLGHCSEMGNQVGFTFRVKERDEFDALFHELSKKGEILIVPSTKHFPMLHGVVRDYFGLTWYLHFESEEDNV